MRTLSLLSLCAGACLAAVPGVQAATRTWPGAAPCDGALQACIDASAAADTVLVASNATIAATVHVNKPLTLRAAAGYRPAIAPGFAIGGNVSAAGTWTWHVEGFTLQQGFIALTVSGGAQANVVIRDMHVLDTLSGAAQVSVFKNGAADTTLNYLLEANVLNYSWSVFDGGLRAALQVLDGGSGSSVGVIRDNRIRAGGSQSLGILVSSVDRTHRVGVAGNQVQGGQRGSITLRQGSLVSDTGGTLEALVTSNFVRSEVLGSRNAQGIVVDILDGSAEVDVLHNTVVDARRGIEFSGSGADALAGSVVGNVLAYLDFDGLQRFGAAAVSDSSNLFWQTGGGTAGLNPDSLFVDPRLRSAPGDARLRPDSPAIDRLPADTLRQRLIDFGIAATDADGLRRFKRPNSDTKANLLDLGAFEAGDTSLVHAVPTLSPGNVSNVDAAEINGFPGAYPVVTPAWNPDQSVGIYNDHPVSLRYLGGPQRWQLRQESLFDFTAGARFFVLAPGIGDGRFLHTATAANTGGSLTELDHGAVNNVEDAILIVSRNPGTGTVMDVVSPLGVNYFSGTWSIVRLDNAAMPDVGGFNVYTQPPSIAAFRHRTSAGNLFGHITDLDNPLLNGQPCARLQVTQATDFVIRNDHHIGVYYDSFVARWSIFNQDFATLPLGAEFHVVVDGQRTECGGALFGDGFEAP